MTDQPPVVLTVAELQRRLRMGRRQVYETAARGTLSGTIRLGRSIRISATAVDRWLEGNGDREANCYIRS